MIARGNKNVGEILFEKLHVLNWCVWTQQPTATESHLLSELSMTDPARQQYTQRPQLKFTNGVEKIYGRKKIHAGIRRLNAESVSNGKHVQYAPALRLPSFRVWA
jgi:hypothetical protein